MNFKKIIGLLVCISFFIVSCRTTKQEKPTTILTQSQKLDNTAVFIDACREKIAGNKDKAVNLFLSCIKTDPTNAAAYYEIAGLYYLQKKDKEALNYIEKAIKIDSKNNWYKMLYANILVVNYKLKEAIAVYENLVNENPNNLEYYNNLAEGYLYFGKYSNAIEVYDKLETIMGITEELSLQKEKLYLELKKYDKAEEELLKLINEYPSETTYYNYLAYLYLNTNKAEKAFELYQKILSLEPNNANVHLALADYYRSKGDNKNSFNELKIAFENPYTEIDTKVKILMQYYVLSEKSDSLKNDAYLLTNMLLQVHPDDAKAYSIYADFLYRDNKLEEARKQYRNVISLDSSKYVIWENLFLIETELLDYNALENESKRAIELFPEQMAVYYYNGMANFFLKKYDEAISSFNAGLKMTGSDKEVKKNFYIYIADSYHAKKNNEEAFSYYEKVLAIDPENAYVLNNYSYYLTLINQQLDKAAAMSEKAVKANPSSSSYLDTYGWVLYKQEKYNEAAIWLKKALDNKGDENATILEHYGDVMYKLGNTTKALEYWEKAKLKGDGSEFLEKKINEGKLYE